MRPGDTTENKRGTTQSIHDMQSQNNATASLRQDYPESDYTLISVNVTDLYADRTLYEYKIKQITSSRRVQRFSVFIDPTTGDFFTPGQENAKITADRAKYLVTEAFPLLHSERVRVRYNNSPDSARAWVFTMYRDNSIILTGAMDTGDRPDIFIHPQHIMEGTTGRSIA